MDYDPAHKASSITSTTSTNSSSTTWEQQPLSSTADSAWPPMLFYYYNHLGDENVPLFLQESNRDILSSTLSLQEENSHSKVMRHQENPTARSIAQQKPASVNLYVDDCTDSLRAHTGEVSYTNSHQHASFNKSYDAMAVQHDNLTLQPIRGIHELTQNDKQARPGPSASNNQISTTVHQLLDETGHVRSGEYSMVQPSQSTTSSAGRDCFAASSVANPKCQTKAFKIPLIPGIKSTSNTDSCAETYISATSNTINKPVITTMVFPTKHASSSNSKEKKANRLSHIASEQKRRNNIRSRFNDLTDVIPSLRNNNSSKSVILFKAVDYIKYLQKRNHHLRDKLARLQLRLSVVKKSAVAATTMTTSTNQLKASSNMHYYDRTAGNSHMPANQKSYESLELDTIDTSAYGQLPLDTIAALMVHKNQQKQLQELQEQLRMQRYLLKKHRIAVPEPFDDKDSSMSTTTDTDSVYRHLSFNYESIHIPSRRSSSSS